MNPVRRTAVSGDEAIARLADGSLRRTCQGVYEVRRLKADEGLLAQEVRLGKMKMTTATGMVRTAA